MTEAGPYRDPDRPPRGSPRLYGDCSGLAGVPTAQLRHRSPSEWARRQVHQKLIIAACHDARIAPRIVADFLGLKPRRVQMIYRMKVCAESRKIM